MQHSDDIGHNTTSSFGGTFQSEQHLFAGNVFHGDVYFHKGATPSTDGTSQALRSPYVPVETSKLDDAYTSRRAKVCTTTDYVLNKDIFETGSTEQKRAALLNFLYYEGLDLKLEQLTLADIGPDSFHWIEGTDIPKWLETGNTPFWISGKPGSGKSTLMKYLAESRTTIERLNTSGQQWAVVYFFFDYRAGKSMANHMLGMLKSFLRQLSLKIPDIAKRLEEEGLRLELASERIEGYINIISNVMESSSTHICAFIDGLDEFDDDLWDLCSRLEMLRDRTGLKLCLASRPERAFEVSFKSYPKLTMQEHNKVSIKLYTQRKIDKFVANNPLDENLFPEVLIDAVADKAQGIILWARLVVDDMIKSCNDDSTTGDLLALLESLPSDLEPLYERILDKLHPKYQQESIIIIHLLRENEKGLEPAVLCQAFHYLSLQLRSNAISKAMLESQTHEARLKALLGSLVDFVHNKDTSYQPHRTFVSVRLLHRSLATYLDKSAWKEHRLLALLKKMYPNHLWTRLAIDVISRANKDSAVDVRKFRDQLQRQVELFFRQDTISMHYDFAYPLIPSNLWTGSRVDRPYEVVADQWEAWSDLLLYCLTDLFELADVEFAISAKDIHVPRFPANMPDLALLHYSLCRVCRDYSHTQWHWIRILRLYKADALDVYIHFAHHCWNLVEYDIAERGSQLGRQAMQDLFDTTIVHENWGWTKTQAKENMALIKTFANHGFLVDSRHLCSLNLASIDVTHGIGAALAHAAQLRPSESWSESHDSDCPYRTAQSSIMLHWLLLRCQLVEEWSLLLDVFTSSGLKLDTGVDKHNTHLFAALLEHTYCCLRPENSWMLFIALARHGAHPEVSGLHGNILTLAKVMKNKMRLRYNMGRLTGDRRRTANNWDRLEFYSSAACALQQYKASLDRTWPDLNESLRVRYDPIDESRGF